MAILCGVLLLCTVLVLTGGVSIIPGIVHISKSYGNSHSIPRIFRSSLPACAEIEGEGFTAGMNIGLNPKLELGLDYSIIVHNSTRASIILYSNGYYSIDANQGSVVLVNITHDNGLTSIVNPRRHPSYSDGIAIVVIIEPPVVTPTPNIKIYDTTSRYIGIRGFNFEFVHWGSVKITLDPSPQVDAFSVAFTYVGHSGMCLGVHLHQDHAWRRELTSHANGSAVDFTDPLYLTLTSIDVGPGAIVLDPPVKLGMLVSDDPTVRCDDSCEYARNGSCDDDSEDPGQDDHSEELGYRDRDFKCASGTDCEDCYGWNSRGYHINANMCGLTSYKPGDPHG
jgi:hypothetical protein